MIQKGKQEMLTSGSQTILHGMSIPERYILGIISATLLPMNDMCSFLYWGHRVRINIWSGSMRKGY